MRKEIEFTVTAASFAAIIYNGEKIPRYNETYTSRFQAE
jgi:hypothetical protein